MALARSHGLIFTAIVQALTHLTPLCTVDEKATTRAPPLGRRGWSDPARGGGTAAAVCTLLCACYFGERGIQLRRGAGREDIAGSFGSGSERTRSMLNFQQHNLEPGCIRPPRRLASGSTQAG